MSGELGFVTAYMGIQYMPGNRCFLKDGEKCHLVSSIAFCDVMKSAFFISKGVSFDSSLAIEYPGLFVDTQGQNSSLKPWHMDLTKTGFECDVK